MRWKTTEDSFHRIPVRRGTRLLCSVAPTIDIGRAGVEDNVVRPSISVNVGESDLSLWVAFAFFYSAQRNPMRIAAVTSGRILPADQTLSNSISASVEVLESHIMKIRTPSGPRQQKSSRPSPVMSTNQTPCLLQEGVNSK